MEKSGKQTQRHERHRIHGRHRQARHFQSNEQHQDTSSVSFFVTVFGHKRGSFIAKEQRLPCALLVVRNLRKKSRFSGGVQGERWYDLDRWAWPPCTSRCGIFLEDPESVAWADMGPSTRAHSISCNTLPDSVLSDERCGRETWCNESVVAWTEGACVCKSGREVQKSGLWCILWYQR